MKDNDYPEKLGFAAIDAIFPSSNDETEYRDQFK